jgi:uncharacterized protein (DUF2147 family)
MRSFFILCGLLACTAPAAGAETSAIGLWLRDNGESQIRFSPCGDALCGHVAWVKNAKNAGEVGRKVFSDMKPAGPGKWDGSAVSIEDGKVYPGKLSLEGDVLKTSGCGLGGRICKTFNWTRLK